MIWRTGPTDPRRALQGEGVSVSVRRTMGKRMWSQAAPTLLTRPFTWLASESRRKSNHLSSWWITHGALKLQRHAVAERSPGSYGSQDPEDLSGRTVRTVESLEGSVRKASISSHALVVDLAALIRQVTTVAAPEVKARVRRKIQGCCLPATGAFPPPPNAAELRLRGDDPQCVLDRERAARQRVANLEIQCGRRSGKRGCLLHQFISPDGVTFFDGRPPPSTHGLQAFGDKGLGRGVS